MSSSKDSLILLIDCSKQMFESEGSDSDMPIDLSFKVQYSLLILINYRKFNLTVPDYKCICKTYYNWGEHREPLPSHSNVNFVYLFVCLCVCVSWTGSILASKR